MATEATAAEPAGSIQRQQALGSVSRQPILDLHGKVHGYELIFWSGSEPAAGAESEMDASALLDNALLLGLEQVACGLPVFVNCAADSLAGEWLQVLPPKMTVVELKSDGEVTPERIAACRRLKGLGFRLGLKDFTWQPGSKPLVELADYIKVDFLKLDAGA